MSSAPRRRPTAGSIAFVARGIASNQWWRKGSSHIDQSELWTVTLDRRTGLRAAHARATRVSMWPMWSGDGRTLFYVSDRGGAENVWTRPARRRRPRPRRTNGAPRSTAADDVRTAACCGPRSPPTAARSRSSATSASGRSTPAAARRGRCRSPGAARRRRPRRSACGRPTSSAISRCRPTAGRSRSSRAATSSPRPRATAAMPRA